MRQWLYEQAVRRDARVPEPPLGAVPGLLHALAAHLRWASRRFGVLVAGLAGLAVGHWSSARLVVGSSGRQSSGRSSGHRL